MIGENVPRIEDERLLTGAGRFTDDIALPGQVFAAFVRSPHAHAEVAAIDTARAAAMPGVLGVWRADDLLADGVRPFPTDVASRGPLYPNRDGSLMADPDWLPLSRGRARHVGDAVALVVAETAAQAGDAAAAVAIDWRPLASVTDTATAADPGRAQLWDEAPRNVCFDWVAGDRDATEAGLAAAAHVVSLSVVNNRLVTCFLEPRAAVARFDAASGRFELHVGCQGLYTLQRRLAHVLGVDPERVRVITRDVGGGFGSRNVTYPEYAAVLWAARRLGRPVRWTAGRDEEFSATAQARDTVLSGRLGLDADGMFTALRVDSVCNLGAYHSANGPFTQLRNLTRMLTSVYRVPASYLELKGVFANKAPISSFRGVGRMEAVYMIERLIEQAARETGIDRVSLRRRNLIPPDAMPYRANPDALYDSGDYAANMDIALRAADWDGFASRRDESMRRGRLRGIGIANYIEGAGGDPSEYGAVAVEGAGEGAVRLAAGCVAQGQGHETSLRQIVAAEFGIPLDRVDFTPNDTDLIPAGVGTNASRSMVRAGTALVEAARQAIEAGRPAAARLLQAAPEEVSYADGAYRIADTDRAADLFAVARAMADEGPPLGAENHHSNEAVTYPNGCHVCEVEIDPETGVVELLGFVAVDDVGRPVNPMIVRGQSQGAVAQGLGQALMELGAYDAETGQLLSGSFMDYRVPRADDLPPLDPIPNDVPSPTNPLGVKGAGEGGTTGAPAAAICAILDALAPLGVSHLDMPATPLAVWRAIRSARQGD